MKIPSVGGGEWGTVGEKDGNGCRGGCTVGDRAGYLDVMTSAPSIGDEEGVGRRNSKRRRGGGCISIVVCYYVVNTTIQWGGGSRPPLSGGCRFGTARGRYKRIGVTAAFIAPSGRVNVAGGLVFAGGARVGAISGASMGQAVTAGS